MTMTGMADTAGGIEVEGSFSAKLLAGLHTIAERVERHEKLTRESVRLAQQAAALMPVPYRWRQQAIAGASGVVVLDFGGPAQGRVWELRHVVVGSDLPTTVAAGTAAVYASAVPASTVPAALSMYDVIDFVTSLPNVAFYGPGDAGVIVAGERLFVVVSGATNGLDYQGAVGVMDRLSTPTERVSVGA